MSLTMELTIASPALTWPRTAAVRVWATVALVGYAFLVAHFAFGLGGRGLDHFADRWVTTGSRCSPPPAASCG